MFNQLWKRGVALQGWAPPAFPTISLRLWAAVLLGTLLVALSYLAQSSQAALLSRSIRVKGDRLTQLEQANSELRLEIAALTSPSNLEPRARALGLGPAKAVIYADLPYLRTEMADVLPAFQADPPTPRSKPELMAQFSLWWDSVRNQLGFPTSPFARAAP